MRFKPFSVILLLALLFPTSMAFAWEGKVQEVKDGRTLVIQKDNKTLTVSLYGIGVPESDEPFAQEVKDFVINSIKKQTVEVQELGSGKNIKAITKATGASIDIEDNGKVTVFAPNNQALQEAIDMVEYYDQKPEVGQNYVGTVKNVKDFGAIVEILPGVEGLVHISQLDFSHIKNIHDYVKMGDEMKVKVTEIEKDTNRIRLSRKAVLSEERGDQEECKEDSKKDYKNKDDKKKPKGE